MRCAVHAPAHLDLVAAVRQMPLNVGDGAGVVARHLEYEVLVEGELQQLGEVSSGTKSVPVTSSVIVAHSDGTTTRNCGHSGFSKTYRSHVHAAVIRRPPRESDGAARRPRSSRCG